VRKTIYKKKPKAINVDKNLSEAVQKRVNGLVSMFIGMGAYKPAGILTDNLKVEWKQTCRRIAEKKVKDAEKATIDRVVNTWLELRSFLQSRGRPAPPEMVDLDQFLNHTQAPSRALLALKWMNKNADLELELGNLQVPATPRATGQRGQAPVVEPPLVQALEDRIVEMHAVGDERWSVLLAPWVMAFGCLRYAHIARSEPRPHSSIAGAPRANKSMPVKVSILLCQPLSPTASSGPRRCWKPTGHWHQHDRG
jgi:hypothetical protein